MSKANRARTNLRAYVIKALAHPSRVLIVESLLDGEMCVRDITRIVGADMSTVSKHLTILKSAGLVETDKRGLNAFYRLSCACLGDFFRCVDKVGKQQLRTLAEATN